MRIHSDCSVQGLAQYLFSCRVYFHCRKLPTDWEQPNFTMKCFLGILLAFGILVTLCDAFCFYVRNDPSESTKGCSQDGKLYGFGTSWIANCNSCHCSQNGIRCCSTYHSPRGYDSEKCESIFNKETCRFSVVEKANPSKACEVRGWVG